MSKAGNPRGTRTKGALKEGLGGKGGMNWGIGRKEGVEEEGRRES